MYHSILKHILCLGYGVYFMSFNFQHSYILFSLPEATRLCPVLLVAFIVLTPECQQSMPCGDYLDISGTLARSSLGKWGAMTGNWRKNIDDPALIPLALFTKYSLPLVFHT